MYILSYMTSQNFDEVIIINISGLVKKKIKIILDKNSKELQCIQFYTHIAIHRNVCACFVKNVLPL